MVKQNIKKVFQCDIEKIWNIMTDNLDYSWRSDLSKIDVIDETHFIEYTKNNIPTYFTITLMKKPKEYKFEMENKNIKGKTDCVLKELKKKEVELDFTEEIKTDHFLMKLLAKPYLKSQQKRYMKDLKKEIRRRKEK